MDTLELGKPYMPDFPALLVGQQTFSFQVPDHTTRFRVELARSTPEAPDVWPDKETEVQWHLYQEQFTDTHYHGNSVAHGGQLPGEDGEISAWSWDETPLKMGKSRVVHVVFEASAPIPTHVRVTAL